MHELGVAQEKEESDVGIVGMAAPIMHEGRAVGAVGVTLPAPVTQAARISGEVRNAAKAVTRQYEPWADEIW